MKLTDKQEKFCKELVKNGGNQRQAYLSAGYSNQKGNMDRVDREASVLLSKPMVNQRYEYLYNKMNKNAEKELQWSVNDSLRELLGAMNRSKELQDNKTVITAVDKINTMLGYNSKNIKVEDVTTYEDKLKEVTGDEF